GCRGLHGGGMKIPFLDLVAQDREIGADVRAALADVLAGQAFVLGTHVERFEAAVAAYCGVPHAIGVASGTDALLLSLGGLGVGPGVSVLTTPFSFWATASAIVRLGDGGMVLTRDATLAAHVRQERHQGHSSTPYVHASLGMCSRLDAVQAAALGAKLPRLDGWNARRRTIAARYTRLLEDAGLAGAPGAPLVLPVAAGEAHVFHQYVVRARDRDALQAHL